MVVFAGLKEFQRSLPASASHCGLVALSTEDVKALGRDGFLSHIGCRSLYSSELLNNMPITVLFSC